MALAGWKRLVQTCTWAAVVVLALHGSVDAATVSFSYTGPPVAIPDGLDLSGTSPGAQVGAVIAVAGISQPIASVTISIDGTVCSNTAGSTTVGIDHTFVSDLVITLQSPGGTNVVVINNTDGNGHNFCQVVLDDASAGPSIQTALTAQAPFTGSWQPNAPLSAFAGEVANGNWTLLAQDFFSQDTGSIRAWTINITAAEVVAIPTLSEWGTILLCGLMALIGFARLQRRGPVG